MHVLNICMHGWLCMHPHNKKVQKLQVCTKYLHTSVSKSNMHVNKNVVQE